MSEGFFDRWSRRKQQAREGEVPDEPLKPQAEPLPGGAAAPPAGELEIPGEQLPPEAVETQPLTLEDVKALGIDSDFRPFVAQNVAPEVRNAAFRKLFSDPQFNVMDGLDTYIDDYSKPSPLPEGALRQMASAKFLKLFDEDPTHPEETPKGDGLVGVAQSGHSGDLPSPPVADAQPASQKTNDHDADLRLQPDDAPRAEDARGSAD
ncbi:DUF3306 domain-containing protein [Variovorax sp. Sphag1AA]|uniref:DUF3306 domain-containing protein n=1 Tax=Variovorax sp. Sphag1AA TaxID=2587027 RepID=UPI001609E7F0|nr:DUF3306 domain-containing protein [Variovorax sp. Sphag1AA]MBB3177450.1 hypothetical protein [Variovorax sp. Sphag1AA]